MPESRGSWRPPSFTFHPLREAACFASLLILFGFVIGSLGCNRRIVISGDTAITGVTIVDIATGNLETGMTVVILGDRIAAVDRSDVLELAPETDQIRGDGMFLIPGLWDMHIHVSGPEPQPRVIDLPLYIANGVTGIRFMSGDCYVNCDTAENGAAASFETVEGWRADITDGAQVGPRILASSMLFDGPSPSWPYSYALEDPTEGRAKVREAQARGVDFIKVYGNLPKDVYYAVLEEAHSVGIDVAGHVPFGLSVAEASAAGQKSFEHFDWTELLACSSRREEAEQARAEARAGRGVLSTEARREYRRILIESFDEAVCASLFDILKSNGTWHVPTLVMLRTYSLFDEVVASSVERMPYLPRRGALESWWSNIAASQSDDDEDDLARRFFSLQLDYIAAARQAGAPILAGTDAWNPYVFAGFSLHDELALFVQAGMSPLEALQTATAAPAAFLGRDHELGAIRPGYLADLVLLDANPLEEIGNTRHIAAVIANGRLFNREMLDRLLSNVRDAAAAVHHQ